MHLYLNAYMSLYLYVYIYVSIKDINVYIHIANPNLPVGRACVEPRGRPDGRSTGCAPRKKHTQRDSLGSRFTRLKRALCGGVHLRIFFHTLVNT